MALPAGIRVLELSTGAVGPICGEMLGYMGAEVIKLESLENLDLARDWRNPQTGRREGMNKSYMFNDFNLNKLSLQVNLKHPQGLALVKRLLQISDVFLENFAAGVVERLGLGYEVVSKINPSIVMLSSSGVGGWGPLTGIRSVAIVFTGLSGVSELTGYPDMPPPEGRYSCDAMNGFFVTFALLAALWHRHKTGQGQFIDCSSWEGLSCFVGDSIMDYTMNGRAETRSANRDEFLAPHNCYRCRGQDKWLSIVVATQEEWQACCQALGSPDWSREERFSTPSERWQHQDELDKLIQAWTVNHASTEAMAILQRVGVAAVPSFTAEEIYADPHLAERGMFQVVDHPEAGAGIKLRPPWNFSDTPLRVQRHAPCLGQDNHYIMAELLGLTRQEIAEMEEFKALR